MKTIKNRNNDGRPPKAATEKRKYKITVRFATKEYFSLKEKARQAGITLSEYLRRASDSSVVRERLRPQHLHHILQLTGMANNLNQISRKANAAGYVSARTEYRYLASEIDDLISRIKDDR
ncbi:MAG: plasmid mobilization relaxosome protein MobC [Alistipes sp.]|nr:plasmid mobilization relaxosome protein MobC [Alistipes sp.]MBR2331056.1 plasmid mobilization relaxosome protein MobC [Alistipes sp.]